MSGHTTTQVNEAGEGIWVVLLLYEEWSEVAMTFCDLLETLAKKHAHVKFLRGVASKIVESYPETNVSPCLSAPASPSFCRDC